MKLWELRIDTGFDVLYTNDENIKQLMEGFDGASQSNNWKPVELTTWESGIEGDIISYSESPDIPLFTNKAIYALEDLIKDSVEFLPIIHEKYNCFVVNVIDVLDCLNYNEAKLNRWGVIDKYDFIKEKVTGHHIFRIAIKDRKRPYLIPIVSDEFRQRVLDLGITGLRFRLVWDSCTQSKKSSIYDEKNPSLRVIETKDFLEHIQSQLGSVKSIIPASSKLFTEVDIYHFEPTKNINFNTLITKGNSYFKMSAPSSVDSAYAELIMHMPSNWNVSEHMVNDVVYGWPLCLLREFGKMVMRRGYWLGQWFVFPNQSEEDLKNTYAALLGGQKFDFNSNISPYSPGTDYCGVMIVPPLPIISNIFKMKYIDHGKYLEGEWPIYFHTLLPLYKDEIMLYFKEGKENFVKRISEYGINNMFDLNRRSIC